MMRLKKKLILKVAERTDHRKLKFLSLAIGLYSIYAQIDISAITSRRKWTGFVDCTVEKVVLSCARCTEHGEESKSLLPCEVLVY